jgi:hypothetical protein
MTRQPRQVRLAADAFAKWTKLAGCFRLATVRHYLLVEPARQGIYHCRAAARELATRVLHEAAEPTRRGSK